MSMGDLIRSWSFLKPPMIAEEMGTLRRPTEYLIVAPKLLGLHIGNGDRFGWGWCKDGYFDRQLKVLRDWEVSWLSRPGAAWLQPDAR
jgi:hypothetical protein